MIALAVESIPATEASPAEHDILVVGGAAFASRLETMLQADPEARYLLTTVATPEDAEDRLGERSFSAVILRIDRDPMAAESREAVALIRAADEDVPVLAVTDCADPAARSHLRVAGADDVLAERELFEPWLVRVLALLRERRQLRERTRDADAELQRGRSSRDELMRVIAHDLKTPLAVMGLEVESAMRGLRAGAAATDITEHLCSAAAEVHTMSVLMDALLAYARLDREDRTFEPLPLYDVVRQAADRALAATPDVDESSVRLSIPKTMPQVQGVHSLLLRLFEHLLGNALKYRGAAAPDIRVATERKAGRVMVTVADNGLGIPEPDRRRVRGLFERVPGRPQSGVGVGLTIIERIIRLHGGSLSISTGHGVTTGPGPDEPGTAFHFSLPAT